MNKDNIDTGYIKFFYITFKTCLKHSLVLMNQAVYPTICILYSIISNHFNQDVCPTICILSCIPSIILALYQTTLIISASTSCSFNNPYSKILIRVIMSSSLRCYRRPRIFFDSTCSPQGFELDVLKSFRPLVPVGLVEGPPLRPRLLLRASFLLRFRLVKPERAVRRYLDKVVMSEFQDKVNIWYTLYLYNLSTNI